MVTSYQQGLCIDGHDLLVAIQWPAVKSLGISYVFSTMGVWPFSRLASWTDKHGLKHLDRVLDFVEERSACFLLHHIAFCVAVRYNHLPILRHVGGSRCHERTGLDFTMAMDVAAKHGHLDIIQWLHANRKEGCTSAAMDHAARNGHVDVCDWLHHTGLATFSSHQLDVMKEVVMKGDLRIVEWLHRHRTRQWPRGLMDDIAAGGNVRMMAFFHHHTTEQCTTDAMDFAACRGHLEMVQFLHHHRHEGCTTQAIDLAAGRGHFDVVKWLYIHRHEACTWNAIYLAACGGHMRILYYLARVAHVRTTAWRCAQVVAQTSGRLDALAALNKVAMAAKRNRSRSTPHFDRCA
ncbi:hypothetical protein H310_11292 [Aphanomyces invadans]|uniref:Uncharacterized protein n=1 Tax=Aphanomyces invadans TaxID=157072 RepID=A0A024TN46_9STRA|nr:hypothetical protein H310_11292 [Aphanomyces invadans]ETV95418.1 hypothetical protein H310_11292 [Aphanomyces invadans]|eukprot:XP_008876119.1 hypothetical protein H310_11292 [Aphanomyces invadans]